MPRISEPSGDAEDISLLSPEEREKRRSFESKRKKHYNEFQAVKMARALMDEDDSEVLRFFHIFISPVASTSFHSQEDEKSGGGEGGEVSRVAGGGEGGEGGSGTPMETGQ